MNSAILILATLLSLTSSKIFAATGGSCDPHNAIQDYIASKNVRTAVTSTGLSTTPGEEAARAMQNFNQRFSTPGTSSLAKKYNMDSVLKDMQELTDIANNNNPAKISLAGAKGQNTVEATRDALNLLKKKAENLSQRLSFLSRNNGELQPLLEKPIQDLERDRKSIENALSFFQKNQKLKPDAILSNVRITLDAGALRFSSGSLGELQVAARMGSGVQKGVNVSQLLKSQSGLDFEAVAKASASQPEVENALDEAYRSSNLSMAEKIKLIARKEIDLRYIESSPQGPREVWTEVKNVGHEVNPADLMRSSSNSFDKTGASLNINILDQARAMKVARDIMVKQTGQPIQLEFVFINGISPQAQQLINQTFPGVFRFR